MLSTQNTQAECFFWNAIFVADLFSDLPPKTFEAITNIKQRKQFPENTTIFSADEFPSNVYVLIKGQAQMILNNDSKNDQTQRAIKQGEIIGLTETIACLPHSTNLVTLTACVFDVIQRKNLIHFLSHEAEVSFRLVKLLGMNLQKSCFPASDH